MSISEGVTRREFVSLVGGAAVGTAVTGASSLAAQTKRRYAIVGTGVRAVGMWGRPIAQQYSDVVEFVGLCDINPLRAEVAKKQMGVACPTFTSFDEMVAKTKPVSWYLDARHGADYFRRWHRLRSKSGSLWVHKSTHHFDLIN